MKLKTMTIAAGAFVAVALAAGLASPLDKIINARGSLYLNVDADNNSTGEVLTIATDTASDVGGTPLVTIDEYGRVGIGTTEPKANLHVGTGAIVSGISICSDVPGIDYPYQYETIGTPYG